MKGRGRAALKRICCIALTLIACGSPGPESRESVVRTPPSAASPATSPATATSATPAQTQTPTSAQPAEADAERNISIEEVRIGNPLTIRGRARTFENNVALRVRGADGGVVALGFTTSRGEMGNHNPFEGSLWLPRDPGKVVTVEAFEHSAKDGSEQSLAAVEKKFDVGPIQAKLYFPNADCTRVDAFVRTMPKSVAMARLVVEALIAGPDQRERAAGAAAPFPQGSAVRSIVLRDGVITVDFDERLQNVGGSCRALMIRQSVTQTLRELPAVKRVILTAGGSEKLALQP